MEKKEKKKKEIKTEKKVTDETIMYKPESKAKNTKKQNEQRITKAEPQGNNAKKTEKKTDTKMNDTTPLSKPKQKKDKKHKKHPKLRMFLKIILILFILGTVTVAGILGAIVYRCVFGDWAISEEDLTIKFENTTMLDKDGNVVAVLTGDENREIISKEDMSKYFFDAFIAIEDERFEDHHGVDWKRTLGAFVTFATNSGESSFGGSTLTQQVVKNLTAEDSNSGVEGAMRKIKEIVRAYEVENILSKDQILELYLNLVSFGGGANNIYGVQTASLYYFNKNAKDVSLVEAAYIAGITNAPNRYNPFDENVDRTENINKRVKTVLNKMYELGRINEEEYNNALSEVEARNKI